MDREYQVLPTDRRDDWYRLNVVGRNSSIRAFIQGGLGNQLFTIAAGYLLAVQSSRSLILDLRVFKSGSNPSRRPLAMDLDFGQLQGQTPTDVQTRALPKSFARLFRRFLILRPTVMTDTNAFQQLQDWSPSMPGAHHWAAVLGYFQSDSLVEKAINAGFGFAIPHDAISPRLQRATDFLQGTRAIGIHIRRGDFLDRRNSRDLGVLGTEYYIAALQLARQLGGSGPLVLFSDDVNAAYAFLSPWLKGEEIHVAGDFGGRSALDDLFLMQKCCTLISSNSTFAWWAARTTQADANVIAPQPWFRNGTGRGLERPSWTLLDSGL